MTEKDKSAEDRNLTKTEKELLLQVLVGHSKHGIPDYDERRNVPDFIVAVWLPFAQNVREIGEKREFRDGFALSSWLSFESSYDVTKQRRAGMDVLWRRLQKASPKYFRVRRGMESTLFNYLNCYIAPSLPLFDKAEAQALRDKVVKLCGIPNENCEVVTRIPFMEPDIMTTDDQPEDIKKGIDSLVARRLVLRVEGEDLFKSFQGITLTMKGRDIARILQINGIGKQEDGKKEKD